MGGREGYSTAPPLASPTPGATGYSARPGSADKPTMARNALIFALFFGAAALLIGLGYAARDGGIMFWGDPQQRAHSKDPGLGRSPFEIGPASKWEEPGLYLDYERSHQVALVSRNNMLVAVLLVNPDTGAAVVYDRTANLFKDPRDGSTYTTDGLLWGESEGNFSLERCRIRHLGPLDDPDVELVVDPNKRFAFERQEWSKAASNHLYVDGDGG